MVKKIKSNEMNVMIATMFDELGQSNMEKKETLKDSIQRIVGTVFSRGMEFQAREEQTNKDATDFKKIIVKELILLIK